MGSFQEGKGVFKMRTLTIWMNKDVVTVRPDQTVLEACVLMKKHDIGSVIVVEDKKPVGIFTERDLLVKIAGEGKSYEKTLLKEVMTRDMLVGAPTSDCEEVYSLMRTKKIRHLPIVENGVLIGILSSRDLFRFHMQMMDQTMTDMGNELTFLKRLLDKSGEERLKSLVSENDQLKSIVMIDSLTGLFNYRYFENVMVTEISRAKRHGHPLTLLFMDIDDFKRYNDINGHEEGNKLLKQLADLLKRTSRVSDRLYKLKGLDIIARYGGEEFVIVLPETNKNGGYGRAKRLLEDIRNTPFLNGEKQPQGKLTVSIGVAEFPSEATSWEDLVRKADEALYRAKKNGKNQCV